MDTKVPFPKHKPRFYRVILAFRSVESWVGGIFGWWKRFTYRRALERLEDLNDYALRDIGMWREPESRMDEWWMMNPPP